MNDTSDHESRNEADGARRFALLLEYDGAGFAGSQLQANVRTVQSVLEDAIERATEAVTRVAFAGRTDAGVHARGQVASFLSQTRLTPEVLQRALNAWLPADVAVKAVVETAIDFDPRRDARRRHYRYVVENGPTRPALDRERTWHVSQPLDVPAMAEAAGLLLGRHDFAAFASPLEDTEASPVRDLYRFDVNGRGNLISFDVVANAFLPHQVRRMVGALVDVGKGKGKRSVGDYGGLLEGPPASAGPAAPAHGLYLVLVEYEVELFPRLTLDSDVEVC